MSLIQRWETFSTSMKYETTFKFMFSKQFFFFFFVLFLSLYFFFFLLFFIIMDIFISSKDIGTLFFFFKVSKNYVNSTRQKEHIGIHIQYHIYGASKDKSTKRKLIYKKKKKQKQ